MPISMEASCRHCARRPAVRDVGRKAEQIDHLLDSLKPRILIFDEFHNALRGRARDVEAVLAFLRRIGRQFDISPVLIGESPSTISSTRPPKWRPGSICTPCRAGNMARSSSRCSTAPEATLPLARVSDLSDEPMARMISQLSEGLIGETVAIGGLGRGEVWYGASRWRSARCHRSRVGNGCLATVGAPGSPRRDRDGLREGLQLREHPNRLRQGLAAFHQLVPPGRVRSAAALEPGHRPLHQRLRRWRCQARHPSPVRRHN